MAVHGPLNAFSFDIPFVKIGKEIKLLEHFKKNLDHLYKILFFLFIVWVLGRSIRKRRKKWGLSFKKISDDVTAQKWDVMNK
jgi:hypothetical protein